MNMLCGGLLLLFEVGFFFFLFFLFLSNQKMN